MTLTLAIPCHNDAEALLTLLQRVCAMGIADEVIVVDDGSHRPLGRRALIEASGLDGRRLTLLRHATPRGPGTARNAALALASGTHLLFLDADDLPAPDLPGLLADLDGRAFDFCIFRHHDSRMEQERVWGQTEHEERFWRAAGLVPGALRAVTPEAAAHLAMTANYPWNKVYRTEFLRRNRIRCTDILVHEDVELHWRSFLRAERILASDRVGVVHRVSHGGVRLTNYDGPERLRVFAVMERIANELEEAGPGARHLVDPFFRFGLGLCVWISHNLRAEFREALSRHVGAFLRDSVPAGTEARLRRDDPALMAWVDDIVPADGA